MATTRTTPRVLHPLEAGLVLLLAVTSLTRAAPYSEADVAANIELPFVLFVSGRDRFSRVVRASGRVMGRREGKPAPRRANEKEGGMRTLPYLLFLRYLLYGCFRGSDDLMADTLRLL